jgi:hypothetical protein
LIDVWSCWQVTLLTWLEICVEARLLLLLERRFASRSAEPVLGNVRCFGHVRPRSMRDGRTSDLSLFGVLQRAGVRQISRTGPSRQGGWVGRVIARCALVWFVARSRVG